jgi:hypothetical protein
MNCTRCNAQIRQNAKFCGNCGIKVAGILGSLEPASIDKQPDDITIDEEFLGLDNFKELIGSKYSYYKQAFSLLLPRMREVNQFKDSSLKSRLSINGYRKSFKLQGRIWSSSKFNWSAAFFIYYWLAYRKCYKEAAMIFLVETLAGFWIQHKLPNGFIHHFVTVSILFVILGKIGNLIYLSSLEERLKAGGEVNYADVGGTNILAALVLLAISIVIGLTASYLSI